ncbi:NADH-quinone oxidoreductase subunit NuoN [Phaeospirillum tilakii]|uniref:NADH-quinone oxidoreductase subunit N n=1 Tax=Phaeospirillum tilakii TaxID=741673 RepID=A0ABW5CF54_9PROT
MTVTLDLLPVLPELFLALSGLLLVLVGVFRRDEDGTRTVATLAIMAMVMTMLLVWALGPDRQTAFAGLFVADRFAAFAKQMILVGAILSTAIALPFLEREQIARFEFPLLILLSTLGLMTMVSANDFMTLYMGLELGSLPLYVLAAYHRDSARSAEAGVKYFVLGALASGLLLYGVSLLYGFAGTTSFLGLARGLGETGGAPSVGIVVGLVLVVAGLAFKISAAPFHMWTPDVYEGAPTPVTAFFSVAPKIAALCLLTRVMVEPFGGMVEQWRQVVIAVALLSMLVGGFAALGQRNIKRLMAYSSIGHAGYALVGLAAGSVLGVQAVLIYLAIYLFMNIGVFAVILSMRRMGQMVERIEDLAGLARTQPAMAFVMAMLMFSMAGIPPLAGFWGKFYVFMAAIEAGLYPLAVLGVLTSVVAAFYYLRIVKLMYFDEPVEAFDRPIGPAPAFAMGLGGVVVLGFTFLPAPLVTGAKAAAAALFPAG